MLIEGTKAPAFTLPDESGNPVSLSDFTGKKVVVYFYPKDNTPGCTRQACAFAAAYEDFKKIDVAVIGISPSAHTLISLKNMISPLSCFPIRSVKQSKHTMYGKKRKCTGKQAWESYALHISSMKRESLKKCLKKQSRIPMQQRSWNISLRHSTMCCAFFMGLNILLMML